MRKQVLVLAGALPVIALSHTPAVYSRAVTGICAGALLFDRTHPSGTRAGAIAVSRDIRATGMRRLRRIEALPKPQRTARQDALWIRVERRLIEMYASDYLQIWDAIEAADTPAKRGALPAKLRALIDRPDRLQHQARALEQTLNLPDCTGGMKP